MDLEDNQKQISYINLGIDLNSYEPQFLHLPKAVNERASYRIVLRIIYDNISKY